MSLLDSLLRFVDPVGFQQRMEERERKRVAHPPDAGDDDEVVIPPAPASRHEVMLECRVCGHLERPPHRYCPRCLAETMVRRR